MGNGVGKRGAEPKEEENGGRVGLKRGAEKAIFGGKDVKGAKAGIDDDVRMG